MEWPDNLIKGLGMDPSNYNRDGLFAALALLPFYSRKFITLYYKHGWPEEEIKAHYKADLATTMARGLDLLSHDYKKYIEYPKPEINNSENRKLDDLGFSSRTRRALDRRFHWLHAVSIDELSHYSWSHFIESRGMGEKSYWELFRKLQEYGVPIKEDLYVDRDFTQYKY